MGHQSQEQVLLSGQDYAQPSLTDTLDNRGLATIWGELRESFDIWTGRYSSKGAR